MRTFGHIDGTFIGDIFDNRVALAKSGIHPPTQAGISGGSKEGADSIVLSGGYEDDEDLVMKLFIRELVVVMKIRESKLQISN